MGIIDLTKRHYRDLSPPIKTDEHPVDRLLDSIPEIAKVDTATRRLSRHLQDPRSRGDQEVWMQYEDLRDEQQLLYAERSFDLGYEYGRFAGLTESLADIHWPVVDAVCRALQDVAIETPAGPRLLLAAFLSVARALVLHPAELSPGALGNGQSD